MKASVLLLLAVAVLGGGRNAIVDESTGPMTRASAPAVALCGAWPASATDIEYAISGVGMGGRFMAYRFTAPLAELEAFA